MPLGQFFSSDKSARLLAEAQRLIRDGAYPDAARQLEAAIAEGGSDPALHSELAAVLERLGDYEGAVEHFRRSLDALAPSDPGRPRAMLRLAASLQDCNKVVEAQQWYRKILEIDPANPAALLCLAVLVEDGDVSEARGLMDRYIAADAGGAGRLRRALMLPVVFQSVDEIESIRTRLDHDLDGILSRRFPEIGHPEFEVGSTPFNLAYHGRNNAGLLRKVARACRSVYPGRTECSRGARSPGGPLRIGFVSTFFHAHAVGRTMHGLIHDLPRDRFQVHVFAITPQADALAEAIRRSADRYVALPRDLDRVREAIESAALDILFFADIGMDPLTYFLAFWRLAPIQMVSWGHSVTSGIDTVDYYVSSDAIEAPGSEQYYTEKLVRLPGYFMPRYKRPALDGEPRSRGQLGLPEGKHLYYCPQNLFKLHPDFDPAMKAILERDPEAEILLVEFLRPGVKELVCRRFARTLGPLASRVHFLPRMTHRDYLQYLSAADVILDPFHFGGCNSSCDALSLGVPIATLPGAQLPGRFTLGLYKEIGVESCIARSPDEFVEIALRLGRDSDYRRSVSERISAQCARLFDRPDTGVALGKELLRIATGR
ncbi:MAG TPA: tetratricopeptide repeat protein [Stellaceae bacterium]|nr:tetratricopeptide repeat protein [Stellaceae bacterium]